MPITTFEGRQLLALAGFYRAVTTIESCTSGIGAVVVNVNVDEAADNKDTTKEVLWQVENP